MSFHRFRDILFGPAVLAICAGLAGWLLATPPVRALVDGQQLLSGLQSATENSTRFTAPGGGNQFLTDFPGAGLGEQAASIRMPAGTVGALRVNVTTQNVPDSGTFSVMVRLNGADTLLTCQVAGTGFCTKLANVTVRNNDLLAIRASNNFVNAGSMTYSYTMTYD